jgi:hypothetical protein
MRSLKSALGAAAILLLLTPASAHAWWGWLDDLSGPGRFYGQQYEVRVACFGDEFKANEDLKSLLLSAKLLTSRLPLRPTPEDLKPVGDAWNAFASKIKESDVSALLSPVDVATFTTALDAFNAPSSRQVERGVQLQPVAPTDRAVDLIESASRLVEQVYKASVSINSTGVLWSLCSTSATRRFSIEVGVSDLTAAADPRFAGFQPVRLITAMPSVTYRLFKNPSYDMVDVGAGAGVYWFSSPGFETFHGLVLQPGRVDVHAPTNWVNAGGAKSIVSLFTLQTGLVAFPAGFDAGAFGPGTKAISGTDFTWRGAVFLDATALLRTPHLR